MLVPLEASPLQGSPSLPGPFMIGLIINKNLNRMEVLDLLCVTVYQRDASVPLVAPRLSVEGTSACRRR